jgi:subtilisin family serine protease
VRKRWLGILALALATLFASGLPPGFHGTALADAAPGDFGNRVIVQYQTQASHEYQIAGGDAPSLEAQGFRELTVPAGMTRDEFIRQLQQQPGVLSAEPDAPVYAAATPNDPYYLPNQAPYLDQIGAPGAWDIETGSHQVIVAVLDSGIDLNHPDFAGRLWQDTNETPGNGADDDHNGCIDDVYGCRFVTLTTQNRAACGYGIGSSVPNGDVRDDNGTSAADPGSHGTFVSGIIGAAGNNGLGVTGIDWDVRLMTVKVLDCGSDAGRPRGSLADVAKGIDYARIMGANIINLSLSTQQDSTILRTAVQQAQAQGIIIVAAAGNFGGTPQPGPGYPAAYAADYPNVVAVAASDNLNGNQWASYSAYGPAIDLAAPGNRITSTIRSDLGIDPPYGETGSPDEGYEGGTSFAAPQVAGMFALMISRNPGLGASQYIALAEAAATPVSGGPAHWAGSGVINIAKAVASVPMTISGAPLQDWMDVPPGADVRAVIDGNSCGESNVTAVGQLSRYDLRVASAIERPGCGVPGSVVTVTINGQPAYPTVVWGGQNQDLGISGRDVSTVSPPPGAQVTQHFNGEWSNVAHLGPSGAPALVLNNIPAPWTAAYFFDTTAAGFDGSLGRYLRYFSHAPAFTTSWPLVHTYDAFWVEGASGDATSPNPYPPAGRTVQLHAGWNNITYTGANRAVLDALRSIGGKFSTVLQYNNTTGQWLRFTPGLPRYQDDFGGMFTLQVYWIYMTADGSLTMN